MGLREDLSTDFVNQCNAVMDKIEDTFKDYGFIEKYLEYTSDKITKEDLKKYIKDIISELEETEREDLNHMHAILSDKNCWYVTYDVGEILHEVLMDYWNAIREQKMKIK